MKFIVTSLLLLLITACSAPKNASAIYQTRYDFSQVEKYSIYDRNSEFSEFQNISDITRNGIEIAIEKSMEKQGFHYSEQSDADLIVSYHIINGNRQDYSKYNKGVRYCEHCVRASTWQAEEKDWSLSPGNLILDLVDPKSKRSVWRSVYPLDIDIKDNSRAVNEKILNAVNTMLIKFPHSKNKA